jgi:hypothetical protein
MGFEYQMSLSVTRRVRVTFALQLYDVRPRSTSSSAIFLCLLAHVLHILSACQSQSKGVMPSLHTSTRFDFCCDFFATISNLFELLIPSFFSSHSLSFLLPPVSSSPSSYSSASSFTIFLSSSSLSLFLAQTTAFIRSFWHFAISRRFCFSSDATLHLTFDLRHRVVNPALSNL